MGIYITSAKSNKDVSRSWERSLYGNVKNVTEMKERKGKRKLRIAFGLI